MADIIAGLLSREKIIENLAGRRVDLMIEMRRLEKDSRGGSHEWKLASLEYGMLEHIAELNAVLEATNERLRLAMQTIALLGDAEICRRRSA